jgi:hypothetical protein
VASPISRVYESIAAGQGRAAIAAAHEIAARLNGEPPGNPN